MEYNPDWKAFDELSSQVAKDYPDRLSRKEATKRAEILIKEKPYAWSRKVEYLRALVCPTNGGKDAHPAFYRCPNCPVFNGE